MLSENQQQLERVAIGGDGVRAGLALTDQPISEAVPGLPDTLLQLRAELGPTFFDDLVAHGAALNPGDSVAYARQQIRLARKPSNRHEPSSRPRPNWASQRQVRP